MGPYAGVDYNLIMSTPESTPTHFYHEQRHARVDFIPQSGTSDLTSGLFHILPEATYLVRWSIDGMWQARTGF